MNEREILGAGTRESEWLRWLAEQHFCSASMSELCHDNERLVVVAPHPDDEILACGGLLALRAERGLKSLVVAVTNGEASHGTTDAIACARLSERRAQESHAGLNALGISSSCVVRLGIPDGQAVNMISTITLALMNLLEPHDVILSTWNLDGHPDHEATSVAARQAADTAGCRLLEAPVWMWHWARPGDPRVPWNNIVAFEIPKRAITAKVEALSRHQSQLEARSEGRGPVLVSSIVERAARAQEYFFQ